MGEKEPVRNRLVIISEHLEERMWFQFTPPHSFSSPFGPFWPLKHSICFSSLRRLLRAICMRNVNKRNKMGRLQTANIYKVTGHIFPKQFIVIHFVSALLTIALTVEL